MVKIRTVVLLGDGAVGKTSLVSKFVDQAFSDDYQRSVGLNTKKKVFPELDLKMMLKDIFGQKDEKNKSLHTMHYRAANGAFMVFDVTNEETFDNIREKWLPDLYSVAKDIPIILLGNKSDLEAHIRFASMARLSVELQELGYNVVGYKKTSAKTGENVEESFYMMARKIAEATV